MVFPEGVKGTGKPFSERYRLQRFGRGGFVEVALRTGAPIVPVAVVGSEEIYPKLAESPTLARAIGAPFVPITPTFPWLGPLGLIPLPSKWRIEFCEPIDLSEHPPEAAEDRAARVRRLRAGPRDDPGRSSTRTWSSAAVGVPLSGLSAYRCESVQAATDDGARAAIEARATVVGPRRVARARSSAALAAVDADERLGPLLAATGAADALRVHRPRPGPQRRRRSDDGRHHLRWCVRRRRRAGRRSSSSTMDSAIANALPPGRESLRSRSPAGRSAVRGDSRRRAALPAGDAAALRALPAGRRGRLSRPLAADRRPERMSPH